MYRRGPKGLEVLLVHPGGPFWAKKDLGAWSIPKGLVEEGATEEETARREFAEETGFPVAGPLLPLGRILQKAGKTVAAWAFAGDADPGTIRSNTFRLEWPPRSGRFQEFPEADRAGFFDLEEARRRILPAQAPFLDRLAASVGWSAGIEDGRGS